MSYFYENSYMNSDSVRRIFSDTTAIGANRQPCVVCGHPTGDCTGESGPPTVIFGQGSSETIIDTQTILVEEDIWEERQMTPFTRAKVLVHRKGKYIPFREAEKLGLVERPKLP
jgi:hypothetical protein